MAQSTGEPFVDVLDLERQIEAEVRNLPSIRQRPISCAPPGESAPTQPILNVASIPKYVKHSAGVTEIGRLSAEAVVREYEAAAEAIEAMGAELFERVKQCAEITHDTLSATHEMKETASRYRDEANRIFLQIEHCSLMTAEVRKTCSELNKRIGAPTIARRVSS
jgi:hypothetical protein